MVVVAEPFIPAKSIQRLQQKLVTGVQLCAMDLNLKAIMVLHWGEVTEEEELELVPIEAPDRIVSLHSH